MLKHPQLTLQRVERCLNNEIRPRIYQGHTPLDVAVFQSADPVPHAEAIRQEYRPAAVGFRWGPVWSTAWFRLRGVLPEAFAGQEVVALIDTSSEALVWNGDTPGQGLDPNRNDWVITQSAAAGQSVELYVEAAGNHLFGISGIGDPKLPAQGQTPFELKQAHLARFDPAYWDLYHDYRVLLSLLKSLPEEDPRRWQILYALNESANRTLTGQGPEAAREPLAEPLSLPARASSHHVSAIGHSHIDTAWLWPLRETIRKCSRTFSTVLHYMERYPEYKFGQSQPQLYAFTKEHYPDLYARIKEAVAAGRWEPVGAMWVEADCNIPSGESLVRQVLHGKRYFMEEFGVETDVLYLPDVFGYSAALPQILKKARVDYFMTQKISWNQFNKFPHHTFLWEGLDGTKIFSHFLPADNYNSVFTPEELRYAQKNFKDSDRAANWLYLFGYGDGGGGPTKEMLESAQRVKSLDGVPAVEQEFARDFFRKAEAAAKDLPLWVGELYLELHRGTYTTQAKNKWFNRKGELALRDAEFFASVRPDAFAHYPAGDLDRAWKLVLLNQFHDIIPGSSIAWVYEDSTRQYNDVLQTGERIVADALAELTGRIDTAGRQRPVVVWNSLSEMAYGIVSVPAGDEAPRSVVLPDGGREAVQVADGQVLFCAGVPELGYTVYDLSSEEAEDVLEIPVTAGPDFLENVSLRVEFDAAGLITRLYDKGMEREVLAPDRKANVFQLFDDRPNNWDAWDIDAFYQEAGRDITEVESIRVVEAGPVRGAVEIVRRFGGSEIRQVVRLGANNARLEFVTEVDWHEDCKLLKVAFPVDVHAARATYEIQYGHVERPTHRNTSWDMARFEVVGHKWADLSEGDYGVTLLNDCKYGHATVGNVLRLSLLRAPNNPDPNADRGRHQFTYALYPHFGGVREGQVVSQAYALNVPLRAVPTNAHPGDLPSEHSFFTLDSIDAVIEVVKRAEKEDAWVVRLYEAHNTRGTVTLTTSLPVKQAFLADLLEDPIREVPVEEGEIRLEIKPFEIVTLLLR